MSINVTVHGNPISINRGKMVSLDPDKEFALRRKIRLQQVRMSMSFFSVVIYNFFSGSTTIERNR